MGPIAEQVQETHCDRDCFEEEIELEGPVKRQLAIGNGQSDRLPTADWRLPKLASPHVGRERKHGAKRSPETPASRMRLRPARVSCTRGRSPRRCSVFSTHGRPGFYLTPQALAGWKHNARGAALRTTYFYFELTRKARPALPLEQSEPGNAKRCPVIGAGADRQSD